MMAEGKRQADIAKALDISVMTYHRWRKKPRTMIQHAAKSTSRALLPADEKEEISQLQVENARLRRLVTDLLLEKVGLEEALRNENIQRHRRK
jgi:putative transposase